MSVSPFSDVKEAQGYTSQAGIPNHGGLPGEGPVCVWGAELSSNIHYTLKAHMLKHSGSFSDS